MNCQFSHLFVGFGKRTDLESSSKAEDTIVCLLLGKTLEGKENSLGLFGDQIIGSAQYNNISKKLFLFLPYHETQLVPSQSPQTMLGRYPYLKPSFLYPAAFPYQLARGVNTFLSHGRLTM